MEHSARLSKSICSPLPFLHVVRGRAAAAKRRRCMPIGTAPLGVILSRQSSLGISRASLACRSCRRRRFTYRPVASRYDRADARSPACPPSRACGTRSHRTWHGWRTRAYRSEATSRVASRICPCCRNRPRRSAELSATADIAGDFVSRCIEDERDHIRTGSVL